MSPPRAPQNERHWRYEPEQLLELFGPDDSESLRLIGLALFAVTERLEAIHEELEKLNAEPPSVYRLDG